MQEEMGPQISDDISSGRRRRTARIPLVGSAVARCGRAIKIDVGVVRKDRIGTVAQERVIKAERVRPIEVRIQRTAQDRAWILERQSSARLSDIPGSRIKPSVE